MIPAYIPYEWYEFTPQQQDDLLAEMTLERHLMQMLQDRRDDEQARAQRHVERSISPPVTAAEIIPPCTDAVVAGLSIYGAIA